MRIKLFEEFSSSYKSSIVKEIINKLSDDIDNLLKEYEKYYEKNFERPMSDYDRMLSRLTIVSDMVKSIESYTQDGDILKSVSSSVSPKGNLEINAVIERDGKDYRLNTEVIYAGGHNIQRLHYRYIVKTNIPKTGASEISKEYSEKIKKMSKLDKINTEIKNYETRIERTEEKIEVNSKLNDEEILNVLKSGKDWYEWPTWSEIVKRGAVKNYDNDENVFNQKQKEHLDFKIKFWKDMNVDSQRRYLADYQKTVKKLQAKRDSMV